MRDLFGGHTLFNIRGNVIRGKGGVVPHPDPGRNFLPLLRVRVAKNLCLDNVRQGIEDFFYLDGVYLNAISQDHVLQPSRYPEIPVFIHLSQVAGMQPALPVDGRVRGTGHLVVFLHEEAPRADLPLGPGGKGLSRRGRNNPDLVARERETDRGNPQVNRVAGAGHGYPGSGFRQAVSDGDIRDADLLHETCHQRHGAGGPANNPLAHGFPVLFFKGGMLQKRNHHAGRAIDRRAFFIRNRLKNTLRIEIQ